MQNAECIIISIRRLLCPRTTIQIFSSFQRKAAEQPPQELNGLFLLPKCLYKSYYKALASCTTSVYVNLSKNSFFYAVARFLSESGCKGTNNFNTIQTFKRKNSQKHESFREY